MSIKSYTKAPYKYKSKRKYNDTKIVFELQKEPLTIWKIFEGLSNDIKEILTTSKIAGIVIPGIFIIYGLNLLSGQIIPVIVEKIQKQIGYFDQGTTSLVAGEYISAKQQYLSNPGSSYFQTLQSSAYEQRTLLEDEISNSYRGAFKLSIPSLGIDNISVQANVNSGDEKVYNKVLEYGLAHMSQTGLPISSIKNNIVIYGHSASGNYFEKTGDPAAVFSILNKAKIGDEIYIKIEGEDYKYKIAKTKIVEPFDTEIIVGENNKKQTLTLFTCYPAGNNSKRLVVIANPI